MLKAGWRRATRILRTPSSARSAPPKSLVSFPSDGAPPSFEGPARILATLPRGFRLSPDDLDALGDHFRLSCARVLRVALSHESTMRRVAAVVRECAFDDIERVCLIGPLDGHDEPMETFVRTLSAAVGVPRASQRKFRAWALAGGEVVEAERAMREKRGQGMRLTQGEEAGMEAAVEELKGFWREMVVETRGEVRGHLETNVPRVVVRGQNALVDALEDVKERLGRWEALGFVPAMPGELQKLDEKVGST